MVYLGDITAINGGQIAPTNCVIFGSPCTDLSVAGRRQGLAGAQSGLFMEAVRVIKEMREATNGKYPNFAVWENVPGAFSSNKGEDFRVVLEELARIRQADVSIPEPKRNKTGSLVWAKSGIIGGNGWSIAWRTLDAQYWGVPQRRRRIAVVVDFGGQRAGEILFERKGVSGDSESSIPPWKGIARNPADCTDGYDGMVECKTTRSNTDGRVIYAAFTAGQGAKAGGIGYAEEVSPTLRNEGGLSAMPTVVCRAHGQANAETLEEYYPTLNCNHEAPIVFESHHKDARYTQQKDTSPTCAAYWGTGGNNMPMVVEKQCYLTSGFSKFSSEVAPLRASGGDNGGGSENLVVESRQKSLTAWDYESKRVYSANSVFPALVAHEKSGQNQQSILTHDSLHWIVRRLTPTECERLQGFPDDWTAIDSFTDKYGVEHKTSGWLDNKGKWHKAADSPRYKALGNSIALPQWWWITCKMAKYLPEHATMGSLFDGIGGFPLVWETRHGKGTALWASEIEAFPIAVTEKHFS